MFNVLMKFLKTEANTVGLPKFVMLIGLCIKLLLKVFQRFWLW